MHREASNLSIASKQIDTRYETPVEFLTLNLYQFYGVPVPEKKIKHRKQARQTEMRKVYGMHLLQTSASQVSKI